MTEKAPATFTSGVRSRVAGGSLGSQVPAQGRVPGTEVVARGPVNNGEGIGTRE